VAAPDAGFDRLRSATEIDAGSGKLAARRDGWDALLGYCAYAVKAERGCGGSRGFARSSTTRRNGSGSRPARWSSGRAGEAALAGACPAGGRDRGLSYEKLRVLARLPDRDIAGFIPPAWRLTCVALRDAVEARDEAQMRAARVLRARVPSGWPKCSRRLPGGPRGRRAPARDGACLVRVARHFVETWKPHVRKARTRSQEGPGPRPLGDARRRVQPEGGACPSRDPRSRGGATNPTKPRLPLAPATTCAPSTAGTCGSGVRLRTGWSGSGREAFTAGVEEDPRQRGAGARGVRDPRRGCPSPRTGHRGVRFSGGGASEARRRPAGGRPPCVEPCESAARHQPGTTPAPRSIRHEVDQAAQL